jgi:hypothetical protein
MTGHLLPLADNEGGPRASAGAGPSLFDGFFYALLVKQSGHP